MKQRPGTIPQPGFFERFIKGNIRLILITLGLFLFLVYLISKKEAAVEKRAAGTTDPIPSESPSTQAVPSKRMGNVPRHSSTKEEKGNVTESEVTPEFVKEQSASLIRVMDSQIRGAELTLQHEKDPRAIAEINRRLEAAKRIRTKLEAVNPNNPSTWFFMKDQNKADPDQELNQLLPK